MKEAEMGGGGLSVLQKEWGVPAKIIGRMGNIRGVYGKSSSGSIVKRVN